MVCETKCHMLRKTARSTFYARLNIVSVSREHRRLLSVLEGDLGCFTSLKIEFMKTQDTEAENEKRSSLLEHHKLQTEKRTEVKTEYDIPVDRGWAWLVLMGAFMIATIVIGGIKSFGVLLVEFVKVFDVPKSQMSAVQSLTGFFYLGLGPVANGLASKFSYRSVIMVGGVLSSSGLILSYFAKSINLMFLTYGIITGCGFGLSFSPCVVIVPHHFRKYRALANSIVMAGASTGSIVVPYFMRFLIDEFSLQGCMLILGAVMANIIVCAALFRPFNKYPKIIVKDIDDSRYSDSKQNEETDCSSTKDLQIKDIEHGNYTDLDEDLMQKEKINSQEFKLSDRAITPLIKNKETTQQSLSLPGQNKAQLESKLCASIGALAAVSCQSIPAEIDIFIDRSENDSTEKNDSCSLGICSFMKSGLSAHIKWDLFKRKRFFMFFVYIFFAGYSYHSLFNYLPPFGKENGVTDRQGALLVAIFGISDMVGRVLFGALFDKCKKKRSAIFLFCNIVHFTGLILTPFFGSFLTIAVWIGCYGIFTGGFGGTFTTILSDLVGLEMLSSAWGFICFSMAIAMLINPVISGMIRDISGSWSLAFRVGGACAFIGITILIADMVMERRNKYRQKRKESAQ